MGINGAQRITVFEIISKLVYAPDEEEYMSLSTTEREQS